MHKPELALNNLQWYAMKPNQTKEPQVGLGR